MSKRHKWNLQADKENSQAHCLMCGLKKEVLGKHFGVIYYFDEFKFTFHKTPPCIQQTENAEDLAMKWYLEQFKTQP